MCVYVCVYMCVHFCPSSLSSIQRDAMSLYFLDKESRYSVFLGGPGFLIPSTQSSVLQRLNSKHERLRCQAGLPLPGQTSLMVKRGLHPRLSVLTLPFTCTVEASSRRGEWRRPEAAAPTQYAVHK